MLELGCTQIQYHPTPLGMGRITQKKVKTIIQIGELRTLHQREMKRCKFGASKVLISYPVIETRRGGEGLIMRTDKLVSIKDAVALSVSPTLQIRTRVAEESTMISAWRSRYEHRTDERNNSDTQESSLAGMWRVPNLFGFWCDSNPKKVFQRLLLTCGRQFDVLLVTRCSRSPVVQLVWN